MSLSIFNLLAGQQSGQITFHKTSILKQPGTPSHVLNLRNSAGKPLYGTGRNGGIVRLFRKSWSGKSERRQVIKNRREDRAEAALAVVQAMS